ncbi:alpha/beta fold hydrolase [Deinococcus cellulosilyticus]|uniref:Proline iminopeptidase n=1 Tax=Deinococcus cellulosilyticus (strain DSM 18568 / NBRC 106333 / KACC 11606 / 5516J-15) TaxID=1223518 RepID=A0A511MZ87_DEIC1|nr:alpha/beta fold hydrolase [Deinococcus cellulosilyticus]GEM45598.1 proline iminopeptidase [Deinococcus cellulosilyticus NBRC 106333 = KACC 11606]
MPTLNLKVNGISHWVKIAGQGPPILALHGGPGGNHFVFEHTTGPMLEKFRKLIYLESRGCGRSQRPTNGDWSIPALLSDLDEVLTQLELPEVTLFGNSFGGGLATTYALTRPQRVKTLILQAPWWFGMDVASHQISGFLPLLPPALRTEVQSLLLHQPARDTLEFIWSQIEGDVADRFLFEDLQVAALNRQLWEESGLVNTGEMHDFLLQHPPDPIHHRLGELSCPTLVLLGKHDRNIPVAQTLTLASSIPNCKGVVFENSAHFPDLEEALRFVQAIKDFLLPT